MTSLMQYLGQSNWLASFQFLVYLCVLHRLLDRSLRAVGLVGRQLGADDRVADPVLDALARLCLGMGLLLTFSGLYGYIASGSGRDQASLLLALGSSAVGYSAWTFCAIGAVFDGWRPVGNGHWARSEANPMEEDDEQEPVVGLGGQRRFVGGFADHPDLAAGDVFGGLDGYQRSADAAGFDGPGADPDLAETA